MKRLVIIAVALVAMTGPVYAQAKQVGKTELQNDEIQKKAEQERIDKQYRATLQRTDKQTEAVVLDPWRNMRGTDDTKTKR